MIGNKHLVLDLSVILDLWLKPETSRATEMIFACSAEHGTCLWVSAASLPTLEFIAIRRFKEKGVNADGAARDLAKRLIVKLLSQVEVLSNKGFEQADVYAQAHDLEDAQIAASARCLPAGQAGIVSTDATFDALGELPVYSADQALEWMQSSTGSAAREMSFIDLATQQAALRPQIERNIETVLRHGQYIMGPEVKQFEDKLAAYVGVKHCITASSGTDTLLIAMMALGIGRGDEVITTPFTFVATGEMIALLGATPVFADIDPRTYNIDPARIEAAITPNTKAIMPVSLYGQCADMDAINAIANAYGLPVIEDAAQSFGATCKGRKSCALSTIGSTSFFPSKPLGGYGEGGALFTDDDALAKAMRKIRVHGQDRRYHHPRIGINGRLDTLQAAVLLAKLDRFDWEVAQRQKVGAGYTALLSSRCPGVITPYIEPHNTSVYAQYSILVENRDAVIKHFSELGIPTAVHYPTPLNQQPAYRSFEEGTTTPVSNEIASKVMSLPMGPDLSATDQQSIVEALYQTSGARCAG